MQHFQLICMHVRLFAVLKQETNGYNCFLGQRCLYKGPMVSFYNMESKFASTYLSCGNLFTWNIYILITMFIFQRNMIRYRNFLTKTVRKEVVLKELKVNNLFIFIICMIYSIEVCAIMLLLFLEYGGFRNDHASSRRKCDARSYADTYRFALRGKLLSLANHFICSTCLFN